MPNETHTIISPSDYIKLCNQIYTLIKNEIAENKKSSEPFLHYPRMIVMYEFFRLLRGEGFLSLRSAVGEYQKDLYKMEDEIKKDMEEFKSGLDLTDPRAKYNLESYKNLFNL